MKEKLKFFYTLFAFIFFVFIWIGFFLIPKLYELESLNDESEHYKVILASALDDINKSEKLEINVRQLQDEVSQIQERLIVDASLNNIADLMQKEFKNYNVSIIQISPVFDSYLGIRRNTENEFFNRLPIVLKLKAKFMDLVHLLENTANMSFIMKPDQIVIKSYEGGILSIDLNVSVYISTGNKL
jgi:Tfp pilus assembly protein PilO